MAPPISAPPPPAPFSSSASPPSSPSPSSLPPAPTRWQAIRQLMRWHQPVGTLLLLWPTLWALWLAYNGPPPLAVLAVFVLGTFFMRSAGCALNDYADQHIDGQVERTRSRPLVTGVLQPWMALAVAAVMALLAAGLLVLIHPPVLLWVWALGAVGVSVLYPFCKRFLAMPQAVLGFAFSWGVPMAFVQAQGTVPMVGYGLWVATWFWVVAYDTEYALTDQPDDRKLGVHSSAIWLGRYAVAAVALCYTIFFLLLLGLAYKQGLTWAFYVAWLCAAFMAVQHVRLIATSRHRQAGFTAFYDNIRLGALLFLGLFLHYFW